MAVDDAGDDVGEVGVRLDAVELAGLDERGDDGPMLGAAVGAGEQRVLAVEGEGPDGALDDVVVDLDAAVVEEPAQTLPARERVADRLGELGLLADERELVAQPRLERLRPAAGCAPGGPRGAPRRNGRGSRPRSGRARRCASAPRLAIGAGPAWQARRSAGARGSSRRQAARRPAWPAPCSRRSRRPAGCPRSRPGVRSAARPCGRARRRRRRRADRCRPMAGRRGHRRRAGRSWSGRGPDRAPAPSSRRRRASARPSACRAAARARAAAGRRPARPSRPGSSGRDAMPWRA